MEELKKEIQGAYELLSAMRVSGDAVDVMAAARCKLRRAWELAGGKEEGHGGSGD